MCDEKRFLTRMRKAVCVAAIFPPGAVDVMVKVALPLELRLSSPFVLSLTLTHKSAAQIRNLVR